MLQNFHSLTSQAHTCAGWLLINICKEGKISGQKVWVLDFRGAVNTRSYESREANDPSPHLRRVDRHHCDLRFKFDSLRYKLPKVKTPTDTERTCLLQSVLEKQYRILAREALNLEADHQIVLRHNEIEIRI